MIYHGGDALGIRIKLSGGVTQIFAFPDTVDLLVDLCAVVVALLTGPGDGELNSARMPRTNTGNFTETLVRLARQLLCVPTRGYTWATTTK